MLQHTTSRHRWEAYIFFLFAIALTLLPLQNNMLPTILPTSESWNDFGWLPLIVLAIFYVYSASRGKIKKYTNGVRACFLLTFFVAGVTLLGSYQPPSVEAILRFILVIWTIPLAIFFFLRHFNLTILSILAVLTLHASWGITHFILQHDLGMQILGESRIAADIAGVAKFSVGTEKYIRAYGPYPHANILGGSMLIALMLTLLLPHSFRQRKELYYLITIIVLALLLSFSRAAYIGLMLWCVLFFITHKNIPASSFKHTFARPLVITFILLCLTLAPLLVFRNTDHEDRAASERMSGTVWALNIIGEHPVWRGVGPGQYTYALKAYLADNDVSHYSWEIAPVHSVPLLTVSELGILAALLLFILFILSLRWSLSLLFLAPLLPLLLFDHYLYTTTMPLLLAVLCFVPHMKIYTMR
jgi:hypothetical protein